MRFPGASALLTATILVGVLGYVAMSHPNTPLPKEWNPSLPLRVTDRPTLITGWKLRMAAADLNSCLAAMPGAGIVRLPPLKEGTNCGIDPRVQLSSVGSATVAPIETTCTVALRLAMWEHQTLQPAAVRTLGAPVARIEHLSSYSCRRIRTPGGSGRRMSTHATAEAIDIAGFVLTNGRRITLVADWSGDPDAQAFLRQARDGACRWFPTTLGPDYNSLHADHFHLQSRGWGLCR